jgi:hypothetical protein
LDNGNILLFDNNSKPHGSRALEFPIEDGAEFWEHPPGTAEDKFYSNCCGTLQRLPNGNTLIGITGSGRIIEVTPDHEIVWEFINPARTKTKGKKLIASIHGSKRIP